MNRWVAKQLTFFGGILKKLLFSFFASILMACNSLAGNIATLTPSKTETPIPPPSVTPSLIPTITHTPEPTLPPNLPTIPSGFDWKIVQEMQIVFPIPDGWYYKEERQGNTYAYFATKENIDEVKVFSTGMTINIVKEDSINAVEYAEFYIDSIVNADTTKKVIGSWHYSQGKIVSFQAQIEAEFANAPIDDPDRNKTIYYSTVANTETNTLYFVIFESPTSIWEDEWKKGQVMIQIGMLEQ